MHPNSHPDTKLQPTEPNISPWDSKIDALFNDLNDMSKNPSPRPPAATRAAWFELVSAAVQVVDTLTPPGIRQCDVCLEELSLAAFPNRRISSGCKHPPSCCVSCLRASIKSDHENKIWDSISCPICSSQLGFQDVHAFADPETFAHYNSLTSRAALTTSPNFVWCLECPSGQVHEGGHDQPIVTCQECHARYCFTHQVPWHEDFTCGQYDKLMVESKSFVSRRERQIPAEPSAVPTSEENIHKGVRSNNWKTRISRLFQIVPLGAFPAGTSGSIASSSFSKSTLDLNTPQSKPEAEADAKRLRDEAARQKKARDVILKRQKQEEASLRKIKHLCKLCPGPGCNWPIEKIDGCAHMTCIKCREQFCWKCRNVWVYGHKCWGL